MATLSEMFISGIQKQEGTSLDSASGAAVGAQLAQLQQTKLANKAALQKQMADLEMTKFEKIGGAIKDLSAMPEGAGKKYMGEKYLPTLIESMNMQDKFHPMVLETMIKDQKILAGAQAWVANGGDPAVFNDINKALPLMKEFGQLGSLEEIKSVIENNPKEIADTRKEYLGRQNAKDTAHIAGSYAAQKQAVEIATTGSQKFDEKIGADMAKLDSSGGLPDFDKKIKDMEEAKAYFEKKGQQSGTFGQKLIGITPMIDQDRATSFSNSDLKAALDKSRSFIKLKDNIDSQFAQAEGERQYNMRGPDKMLPDDENAKRIQSMIDEAKIDRAAAKKHLVRLGKIPTIMFNGNRMDAEGLEQAIKAAKEINANDPRIPQAEQALKQLKGGR